MSVHDDLGQLLTLFEHQDEMIQTSNWQYRSTRKTRCVKSSMPFAQSIVVECQPNESDQREEYNQVEDTINWRQECELIHFLIGDHGGLQGTWPSSYYG